MSQKDIIDCLKDIGLTEKESEVYIFVVRNGVLKSKDISNGLNMHKAQVYNILKNLQNKGIVEATLESPMRFTGIPLEKLIDSFIKKKQDNLHTWEKKRNDLLDKWRHIQTKEVSGTIEKFIIARGKEHINSIILRMIDDTEKEFLMIMTGKETIEAERTGIIDSLISKSIKNNAIDIDILSDITEENLPIAKYYLKQITKKPIDVGWHHKSDNLLSSLLIIKDRTENLMIITPEQDEIKPKQEMVALWSTSKAISQIYYSLFKRMQQNAITLPNRIEEVEFEKKTSRTIILRDPKEAYEMFINSFNAAKHDIIVVGLLPKFDIPLKFYPIDRYINEEIRIRIITQLNKNNIKIAQDLLRKHTCEIRHADLKLDVESKMIIIDNIYLFKFKIPFIEPGMDNLSNFQNLLYSENIEYVKKIIDSVEDLWKRSIDIKDANIGLDV
jgi:sugar-specific transcriptional regulator TrmB